MNKFALLTIIGLALLTSCSNTGNNTNSKENNSNKMQQADLFICPMDCEKGKTYDKSGKCPLCEMDLVKKEKK